MVEVMAVHSTAFAMAAMAVVSSAGRVIELANAGHHAPGFFCYIACPAAAISV